MVTFTLRKDCAEGYARLGTIFTRHGAIQTPRLLPVYNFIGGSTTNCGGLWKYARERIFQAKIPLMSETMHFLNYGISPTNLEKWRQKNFHRWYPEFKSPMFLDSGGYQLLNNRELNLERFGLEVSPTKILDLQLDFGGDMIATLDYPLPPNLNDKEARERIRFSIQNSIKTLQLLEAKGDERTKVFIPIHGRTPAEIEAYISTFITRYRKSKLQRQYDGFAVGSLVPLRTKPAQLIEILITVKKKLAEVKLSHLPVHVFGVGSTLIPYLVYLGFDTFDSSTYVQKARNLQYSHPETWANQRATQLQELQCDCATCTKIDLAEMKEVLTSDISFETINGRFKSEFYADIAIHNLNLHLGAVETAIEAAKNGCLEEHLIEFTRKRIHRGNPLDYLATKFESIKTKIGRSIHPVTTELERGNHQVSLKYKSSDFSIPESYIIPKQECILLLFPCSKEKPYSTSRTFKRISAAVHSNLNGLSRSVHFVVISGLYGPVPLGYDDLPQTKNYDYVLTFRNRTGIDEVGKRLASYLSAHGDKFEHIVAVAASKPYRQAIQKGFEGLSNTHIFPKDSKRGVKGRIVQNLQALEQCMEFLKSLSLESPPTN